jgi:hypothetical protein
MHKLFRAEGKTQRCDRRELRVPAPLFGATEGRQRAPDVRDVDRDVKIGVINPVLLESRITHH